LFASDSGVYKGKDRHIAFGGVWSFEFYFSLGRAKALIRMIVAIEVRNKGVVVSRKEVWRSAPQPMRKEPAAAPVSHPNSESNTFKGRKNLVSGEWACSEVESMETLLRGWFFGRKEGAFTAGMAPYPPLGRCKGGHWNKSFWMRVGGILWGRRPALRAGRRQNLSLRSEGF
jgi:hypothetical protein